MALKIKYHFNGKPRLINFANDKYHDIYEAMAAAEGIDFRRPLTSSQPIEAAHALVRSKSAKRDEDREFATDTEAIATLVEQGSFAQFVPELLGDLGCR